MRLPPPVVAVDFDAVCRAWRPASEAPPTLSKLLEPVMFKLGKRSTSSVFVKCCAIAEAAWFASPERTPCAMARCSASTLSMRCADAAMA
jgi:hypothetical protein